MSILYIVRGISGSGKTTHAKELAHNLNCFYYEADMYMHVNGEYKFDPQKLPAAHDWCFDAVVREITNGNNVVVSNTFTRHWEMKRYIDFALEHNYCVIIVECVGEYQNVHGVSDAVISKQKARFVPNTVIADSYKDLMSVGKILFTQTPVISHWISDNAEIFVSDENGSKWIPV